MTVIPGAPIPTGQRLFELLPMVHRMRDSANGNVLRELMDVLGDELDVLIEETSPALRRPVHRDLRPLGCAVHRRSDRLPGAPRRHPSALLAAGRGREHHRLSAPQGHRCGAGATGARRDGLDGARAVEFFERSATTQYMNHTRPHALATPDLRNQEATGLGTSDRAIWCPQRRLRRPRPHRRRTPDQRRRSSNSGPPQHPERRHLPVADRTGAGRPIATGRARRRAAVPHRRARCGRPAVLPAADRGLDHASGRTVRRAAATRSAVDERSPVQLLRLGAEPVAGDARRARPIRLPSGSTRSGSATCPTSLGGGGSWAHQPPAGEYAVDPVLGPGLRRDCAGRRRAAARDVVRRHGGAVWSRCDLPREPQTR